MNDSGISTVVGFILILGLIVSVAAVVKLTYIPDVKKQLEADHMQNVIGDMGDFKAQLDLFQAAASTGIGYSSSANIEMGGGGIPGIDPSATSGTLTMDPAYGTFTVSGYNDTGVPMSFGGATALGRLLYQSNNRYFANQNVSYESGMVILAQPGGSVMLTPPSFAVLADPNMAGRPIISFNPIRMSGTYQSFSSAGTGTIKTSLLPGSSFFQSSTNITNVTFTITSDYAPLWFGFLNSSMAGSGVPAPNYTLTRNANTVTLFIKGKNASFSMIDSSFGAAMGYGYQVPGSPTGTPTSGPTPAPTPTPSPTPTPAPSPTPTPTTIGRNAWISNFHVISSHGAWLTYSADVTLQVLNTGSAVAINATGWCGPPADVTSTGPTNIVLVSGPATNPQNIPLYGDVTYVWRYTFDIKPGNQATFGLGAAGVNTNQVNTTATVTG
jgi:hypothetical protein